MVQRLTHFLPSSVDARPAVDAYPTTVRATINRNEYLVMDSVNAAGNGNQFCFYIFLILNTL